MAGRSFVKRGGWSNHNAAAYRSGLEEKIAAQLLGAGVAVHFEEYEVVYEVPASLHKYTPDFILPNGIIIEGKGLFDSDDRKKHTLIKQQFHDLDIRFVFTSSKAKLYKGSPTSYGMWCEKNGYQYADKLIPVDWLKEQPKALPAGIALKKTKGGSK